MQKQPLILITNDDGLDAQGINVLAQCMLNLGQVVVVAPDGARSGAACAITPLVPVTLKLEREEQNLLVYSCSGTPVDCVKLAYEKVVPRIPDLLVSGINHGDNASISLPPSFLWLLQAIRKSGALPGTQDSQLLPDSLSLLLC